MVHQNNRADIDGQTLLARLRQLGEIGRGADNQLTRLAASDTDKRGRDQFVSWLKDAGLEIAVDRIGNIFGSWQVESDIRPLMLGSHIDTVINAGIYDGSYGVLTGLSVVEALRAKGTTPDRSLIVAAFTNEEGVRYAPDMMGSLVYAGGLATEEALATIGVDGSVLREELVRIGYLGESEPGAIVPSAFIEAHVEQGPVLETEGKLIGAVVNLQGISWLNITVNGVANHAGTTPIAVRADAGLAAAKVITFLRSYVEGSASVATVGKLRFEPNAINVIPAKAEFTVDLRDPDETTLRAAETALESFLNKLETHGGVTINRERLAQFEPVQFDEGIVEVIEEAAKNRGLSCLRMTSGAGHDAQMVSRICPSAMVFVPSRGGISHNPLEHTDADALIAGARVMLDTVLNMTHAV
jgi:N-carbamoyl-L-amino-acid hydrolase